MKKILVTMMALALTIGAQAEKIDSTQFVAFYNYTIQTQDDEGQNVTDSIRLALLVGTPRIALPYFPTTRTDGQVRKCWMRSPCTSRTC